MLRRANKEDKIAALKFTADRHADPEKGAAYIQFNIVFDDAVI